MKVGHLAYFRLHSAHYAGMLNLLGEYDIRLDAKGRLSLPAGLRKQLEDTNVHVIEALPPVVETQMTAARSGKKMPPQECARQILHAIEHDRAEANVGMVKLLRLVESISPALARRIMIRF